MTSCSCIRYFQSLSKGEVPPVKRRYELDIANNGGLSKGKLAALHNQFQSTHMINVGSLRNNWTAIGCESVKLDEILRLVHDTTLVYTMYNATCQYIVTIDTP